MSTVSASLNAARNPDTASNVAPPPQATPTANSVVDFFCRLLRDKAIQPTHVPINPGTHTLHWLDTKLTLQSPPDNALETTLDIKTALPPAPPPNMWQQLWVWLASAFSKSSSVSDTKPAALNGQPAASGGQPIIQPFRAVLRKDITVHCENITGWIWVDRWLSRRFEMHCSGARCDAHGRVELDGYIDMGWLGHWSLGWIRPRGGWLTLNMDLRTTLELGPVAASKSTLPADFDSTRLVFDLLHRLLGPATLYLQPIDTTTQRSPALVPPQITRVLHYLPESPIPVRDNVSLMPDIVATRLQFLPKSLLSTEICSYGVAAVGKAPAVPVHYQVAAQMDTRFNLAGEPTVERVSKGHVQLVGNDEVSAWRLNNRFNFQRLSNPQIVHDVDDDVVEVYYDAQEEASDDGGDDDFQRPAWADATLAVPQAPAASASSSAPVPSPLTDDL